MWREVWRDAATTVDVSVSNGIATVIIPPNHMLDPELYLTEEIQEVDNEYSSIVSGRSFSLPISNVTLNNFENKVKLEIIADGMEFSYTTTLPVYSQTNTTYHVLIPSYMCNLDGKAISSIKAYYYYDLENRYIEMIVGDGPQSVNEIADNTICGNVNIFDISGRLLTTIKSGEVNSFYQNFLQTLRKGVYIIKEGRQTRKIMITH